MCWVLLMSLWMPLLNYARSYKPLASQVKAWVKEPSCVFSLGLSRSQIAGLSFHGNFKMVDFEDAKDPTSCEWLIANPITVQQNLKTLDESSWVKIKVIRRPADKREDIVIYKRIASMKNE
jgi:hypothetical protein